MISRRFLAIPLIISTIVPSLAVLSNARVNAQTPEAQPTQTQPTQKIRIAVLDFDYSSIGNPSWLSFLPGGALAIF
jgi:hypothetical protein